MDIYTRLAEEYPGEPGRLLLRQLAKDEERHCRIESELLALLKE
jgi:rubrerythrin